MRKKLIVLVILLLISCVIFLRKVYKIDLVNNTKNIMRNEEKLSSKTNDITVVDVTNLDKVEDFNHSCIFFTNYDESSHWKECKICAKRQEIINHNLIDNGWTLGNSCSHYNIHEFSCECGYNYNTQAGKPNCSYNPYNNTVGYNRYDLCSKCSCSKPYSVHDCIKKDGSRINCLNLGVCAICGYNYTTGNSMHYTICSGAFDESAKRELNCDTCGIYIGTSNYSYLEKISEAVYEQKFSVTIPSNVRYSRLSNDNSLARFNVNYSNNFSRDNNTYNFITKMTFNKHTEGRGSSQVNFIGTVDGMNFLVSFNSEMNFTADTVPPKVNILKDDLTEWSKNKTIIISGTENYCNSVIIKIVEIDNEEDVIFEGKASVIDGNYSISCTPNIEVGINGKSYKCIVVDNCENIIEEIFDIAKVDCMPPNPTSDDAVDDKWAKEKLFEFSATDYGIGDVEIAFNDEDSYGKTTVNGVNFSRKYKFIGDVYEPKQAVVLYKDGLGNISSNEITLRKIDNTSPTIINSNVHNNIITIESHDRHERLGEGSGVVKYRYLTSDKRIENPVVSEENSIEISSETKFIIDKIYEVKYVYVVAEDLVRKCK